jgi:hypothetical protein
MQQPIVTQALQAPQSGYGQGQVQPQPLLQQPIVAPLSAAAPTSRTAGAVCPGNLIERLV